MDTTVTAVAALGLQITATPTVNYIGQDLTYTITAINNGPSNATGVVLTDTLPPDITSQVTAFSSVTGVNPSIAGDQVTASFGELNVNAAAALTITVVPTPAAVSDSPLVNTATLTNNEFNPNPNTATLSTAIRPIVDLAITQFTATPSSVEFADNLTYTAIVTNNGPSPATGVTLTGLLPLNVVFGSGTWTSRAGSSATTGPVRLVGSDLIAGIGNLAVGASATVTIVVIPQHGAVGLLTATVTAKANEFDSDQEHNSASVTTTVLDGPGTLQFSAVRLHSARKRWARHHNRTPERRPAGAGLGPVQYGLDGRDTGLDYQPTTGTIVFPAGVASATIQVPVLADPYDDHNELVGLDLGAPAGGAVLGDPATATLTIQDIDPNFNSPTVSDVQWAGSATSITILVVSFSEPLTAATAANPANYDVASVGRKGSFSTLHGQNVIFECARVQPGELDRDSRSGPAAGGEPVLQPRDQRHRAERAHRHQRRQTGRRRPRPPRHQLHRVARAGHQPEVPGRRREPGQLRRSARWIPPGPAHRLRPGPALRAGRRGPAPHGRHRERREGSARQRPGLPRVLALWPGSIRKCPGQRDLTPVRDPAVSLLARSTARTTGGDARPDPGNDRTHPARRRTGSAADSDPHASAGLHQHVQESSGPPRTADRSASSQAPAVPRNLSGKSCHGVTAFQGEATARNWKWEMPSRCHSFAWSWTSVDDLAKMADAWQIKQRFSSIRTAPGMA